MKAKSLTLFKGRGLLTAFIVAITLNLLSFSEIAKAAYSERTVSVGRSWDLGQITESQTVNVPAPEEHGAIVGIGIAGSNDHVYVWYADGTVSSGYSRNFEYYQEKQEFVLPEGKNTRDIIAMAIAGSNDHVYTWYADGTVSEGWSQDLGAYSDPMDFSLPGNRRVSDIVGIAIAGSNDHVYAWYSDSTVSSGWSQDLGAYRTPYNYELPNGKKTGHIIDIGITGSNDRVYTWFQDVELGSGHSAIVNHVDAHAMDILRRYRLPGLSVAASKNGRLILEKGYGYRNLDTGSRMQKSSRCRIGSSGKAAITALSAMHLDQESSSFSVDQHVYGNQGALSDYDYEASLDLGVKRHQPIVAKAIDANDHVHTWNHNGTVTSGTSWDPDRYTGPTPYTLPPGMTPEDIRAIAMAPNGWVWTCYEDKTYSAGLPSNLEHFAKRNVHTKISLPNGYKMSNIVGMAISASSWVWVWFDDGKQSVGSIYDIDQLIEPRSYTTTPTSTRYEIVGMGIAKSNNRVVTWFSNNTATKGWSRDLDYYNGPYEYDIPDYAYDSSNDWYAWYADMRVDHLLSHTSGLSSANYAGAAALFQVAIDSLDYKQLHQYVLTTRKPNFAPGTKEDYQNHGLGLVGQIVAENSGMSYHDYARTHIIDPLGLNIRAASEGLSPDDAYFHRYNSIGTPIVFDYVPSELGLAAGGWKSNAGDLVRLMLATDGNTNHRDILSAQTLEKMESRPYPGVSSYAHGWDEYRGKLSHSGSAKGGSAYIVKYPENYHGLGGDSDLITVAVCTNIKGRTQALTKLANEVAWATHRASIPLSYDLHSPDNSLGGPDDITLKVEPVEPLFP